MTPAAAPSIVLALRVNRRDRSIGGPRRDLATRARADAGLEEARAAIAVLARWSPDDAPRRPRTTGRAAPITLPRPAATSQE